MNHAEAIQDADSSSWETRVTAASWLGTNGGDSEVSILSRLLRDRDTAVSVAAAKSLLRRADFYGSRLVFAYLASTDAQRGDRVLDVIPSLWKGEGIPIPKLGSDVAMSPLASEVERRGAKLILEWLGVDEQR